ncbi:putative FAD-binding monooxygenase [Aspergillus affinis]|uniref:putative FAD-binding monooxygenase n=1 Tax=Aspergillus affinis TaxID=1070780 RepID=UPI0022FDC10F|nr:FAD/NAD(P)-binding domain-containing protein [Aspergillus affinis]KAI9039944.1 FAD/NAD(P)-binding domain-containing protein [Aspergillus affinis]
MKILLSGAGITSNTLAHFLPRQGHTLTILERAPTLRDTGLQIDLRGPGVEVIRRMGLESALKEKTIREEGIQVVDRVGRRRAWFPVSSSTEGDLLSTSGDGDGRGVWNGKGKGRKRKNTTLTTEWEVMRGDLCRLLFDSALKGQEQGKGKVEYRFGTSIDELHERADGVDVRFSTGEKEEFDLVIGADGQNSKVRELLIAERERQRRLLSQGQQQPQLNQGQGQDQEAVHGTGHALTDPFKPLGVYAGLFTTSWPLPTLSDNPSPSSSSSQPQPQPNPDSNKLIGTAYLAPSKRAIFTRRHHPHRIQVYLFCRTDSPAFAALRQGHMDPVEEKALLKHHFADAGWKTDRLMKALEEAEDFYCERIGFVSMEGWSTLLPSPPASSGSGERDLTGEHGGRDTTRASYTGGRIVLVGDAAYAPSVTTGMGTTAGVVGAYVLAGEIGKHCTSQIASGPAASTRAHHLPSSSSGIEPTRYTPESEPTSTTTPPSISTSNIQQAILNYEHNLRPFITYIQKDLSEGKSAWDSLPQTKFGVGMWNVMLGVCSWLRVDTFGGWVRDEIYKVKGEKGERGWVLPDYEEEGNYHRLGKRE